MSQRIYKEDTYNKVDRLSHEYRYQHYRKDTILLLWHTNIRNVPKDILDIYAIVVVEFPPPETKHVS